MCHQHLEQRPTGAWEVETDYVCQPAPGGLLPTFVYVHYLSLTRNKPDLGKPETLEQAQPLKGLGSETKANRGLGVEDPKQEQKDKDVSYRIP